MRSGLHNSVLAGAGILAVSLAACAPEAPMEAPETPEASGTPEAAPPAAFSYTLRPRVTVAGEPVSDASLSERMDAIGIPAAAALVMVDGETIHSDYVGDGIGPNTLFQAASMSKAVGALGIILAAAEQGVSLDDDIRPHLTSIDMSDVEGGDRPLTLRALLSHTAGANVHGFPGYRDGTPLPSTAEVVLGEGNTDSVIFAETSGEFDYSGGGYTVAQLFAEDITGEPFPALMQRLVLQPLGLSDSTFEFPLRPETVSNPVAPAFNDDGPVEGLWHHYPESAAAGLWTTASDYARFANAILRALEPELDSPIPESVARDMITPVGQDYGLGLGLAHHDGVLESFGHSGANNGYRSLFSAFPEKRAVVVILTNHDRGSWINSDYVRGVAMTLDLPMRDSVVLTREPVSESLTDACQGSYLEPGTDVVDFTLRFDEDGATILDDGETFPLVHTGNGVFVFPQMNLEFACQTDSDPVAMSVRGETYPKAAG
ncbi:MAG: serine hydrolase domain-containing protein [Litorimonas sp.]